MMENRKVKACVIILIAGLAMTLFFFKDIGGWLDQSSAPIPSDIIVCLSYSPQRVDKAVSLLNLGYGKKILATTRMTYARLLKKRLRPDQIVLLPTSAINTYEEVLLLQAYLHGDPIYKNILLVSDFYHLYRVRWTIENLFKGEAGYTFSYVAAPPRNPLGEWWESKRERTGILREIPSIIYYWFGHGLLGLEQNPAWVNTLKYQYLILLKQWL